MHNSTKTRSKQGGLAASLLAMCCTVAYGGTAMRTFEWYRNAAQTDFQVPIVLEEGVDGFSYSGAAADGADLCVFSGSTQLPVEIENWNTSGKSVAWVKVPSFSKNTALTLKWGADADPSPLRDNLWSDARLVMHLADGKDSSTFGASFSRSANETTDGPVGTGNVFGTEARKYNCASMANGQIANMGSNFTISFWLNSANLGKNNGGVANEYLFVGMVPNGQFAILHGYKAGYLELYFAGWFTGTDPRTASGIPIAGEGWHHYVWTYDGTTLKAYRDGSQYSSTPISFTLKTSTSSHVFRVGGATSSAYLSGSLDELRIESVARSANWIAAECETQSQVLCPYIELELSDCAVGETLADFTALVAMDYNDARWDVDFHVAARNEALTFKLPDGTVCPHETERATLNNGAPCSWWVKIPECTAGQKLRICRPFASVPDNVSMIYQNPDAWRSDYMHVFHLSPLPTRYDATGRGVVKAGAETPWAWTNYCGSADGPTGPLLAMKTADKTVAYVGYGVAPPSFSNRYTVAFWARKDDFDNPKDSYVFAFIKSGGIQASLVAGYSGHNRNAFRFYDGTYDSAGAEMVIPDGDWHHYAFVSDGTALMGYRDGELAFTSSTVFDFRYAGGPLNFWVGSASNGNNALIGALDEFSIAYEPRSAAWIRACYCNQNAYRHGTVRHYAPSFARDVAAVPGNNGLAFAADLVCKQSADVTLCWGAADGGETLGAWANTRSLGSLSEGELNELVASLANDQRVCARFYAENACGSAWSLPIWGRMPSAKAQYYAKVTFSGYEGASTLTNFTACVRLPSRLGLPATSGSIRFTTDDGEPLPFEVETWNPAGESIVWVKVPRLTAATVLKVWWGGVDTTGDLSSGGTAWDSTYMRVYHFSGAADSSIEGTETTATLSNYAAAESPAGAGMTFNNQAGFYLQTKKLDLAEGMTLQLWAKITSTSQSYVAVAYDDTQIGFVHGYNGDNVECFVSYPLPNDNGGAMSALRLSSLLPRRDGEWHHYAYTLDGRRFISYLDGVQVTNVPFQVAISAYPNFMKPKAPLFFGSAPSGNAKMTGALDEYRMERVGRSADWIRACWKNQASDTFCTVSRVHGLGFMLKVR